MLHDGSNLEHSVEFTEGQIMEYRRWKGPELRAHFGSDNSQVYLPRVKGTVAYGQFITEYNPELNWDEEGRRVDGEIWSEIGDAVSRGRTWFNQQGVVPIFMKHEHSEVGFMGPVCYCRASYYADNSDYEDGVAVRDAKLKSILPEGHPGRRDIGAYLIIEYKRAAI